MTATISADNPTLSPQEEPDKDEVQRCHVCSSAEGQITRGFIKHMASYDKLPDMPGDPAEIMWKICEKCRKTGWRVKQAKDGIITYVLYEEKHVRI